MKTGVNNFTNRNFEDSSKIGSLTFITPEPGVFVNLEKFKPEINKLKAWKIPENGILLIVKFYQERNKYIY